VSAALPEPYAPSLHLWDKAAHCLSFVVLALLGALAYPRRPWWLLAAGLAAFGALIEGVQALPAIHRDADMWDWVADVLGIGAALGAARLLGLPDSRRVAEAGR
jgi:VanZ family protein